MDKLTVGKLKEVIRDLPDDMECELWSDSGLDQSDYDDEEAVIEDSFVHEDKLIIYGNWRETTEVEED